MSSPHSPPQGPPTGKLPSPCHCPFKNFNEDTQFLPSLLFYLLLAFSLPSLPPSAVSSSCSALPSPLAALSAYLEVYEETPGKDKMAGAEYYLPVFQRIADGGDNGWQLDGSNVVCNYQKFLTGASYCLASFCGIHLQLHACCSP